MHCSVQDAEHWAETHSYAIAESVETARAGGTCEQPDCSGSEDGGLLPADYVSAVYLCNLCGGYFCEFHKENHLCIETERPGTVGRGFWIVIAWLALVCFSLGAIHADRFGPGGTALAILIAVYASGLLVFGLYWLSRRR